MRLFKTFCYILYPIPILVVLYMNPSLNLLYAATAIISSFLLINSSITKRVKSGISFVYKRHLLTTLLTFCFILQSTSIWEVFTSIIKGEFFQVGLEIAKARYSGELNFSFLDWLSSSILFSISLLIGLNNNKLNKWNLILYLTLLVSSLSGLARASFLMNIIFLLSGVLMNKSSEISLLSRRKLFSALFVLGILGFTVYAIPQYGRVYDSPNPLEIVLKKSSAYSISIYYAFSEYMNSFPAETSNSDFKTFGIISTFLGENKKQGMYDMITVPNGQTNVFTIYRGFIEDFGFLLFPIITIFMYYLSIKSFCTNSKISFIFTYWTVPLFLYPFYSIFYFNNVLLGYLLFSLVILSSKPVLK